MTLTRNIRTALSRRAAAHLLIAPLAVVAALAFGSAAQAQAPEPPGIGDEVVLQCSDYFGPSVPGTIVGTPSGNFNANCNPFAPPPSGAGGSVVVQCSEIFGDAYSGNIVFQPNGHFKGHCH